MDPNIIADLRESAEHSERCGWTTHALMDRRAASNLEHLVKTLALIERESSEINIVRAAREALGLDVILVAADHLMESQRKAHANG